MVKQVVINGKTIDETLVSGIRFRKTEIKNIWIDEFGNAYNMSKEKFMKASIINRYRALARSKVYYLHRLVAEAWIQVPKRYLDNGIGIEQLTVDHIDGSRANNNVNNLRWLTHEENVSFGLSKKVIARYGKRQISFKSIREAARYMITTDFTNGTLSSVESNISKAVRKLKGHKTAYQHTFRFKEAKHVR
jgi:hypothetical protein